MATIYQMGQISLKKYSTYMETLTNILLLIIVLNLLVINIKLNSKKIKQ